MCHGVEHWRLSWITSALDCSVRCFYELYVRKMRIQLDVFSENVGGLASLSS